MDELADESEDGSSGRAQADTAATPDIRPGHGEDRVATSPTGALARPRRRPAWPFRRSGRTPVGLAALVGRSPAIAHLRRLVARVAPYDVHVFLHGASGTGRELVARAVHAESHRRDAPFLSLDCATLPAVLVESELFGHEQGAVTGALTRREGCLGLADRGVLFLDRIGHMPVATQTRLLRVLDGGPFRTLGGTEERAVDVRIIAGTPVALDAAIREGRFRADLYHRLNEFTLHLPRLRDRREDVPDLVDHFLRRLRQELGKPLPGVAPDALRALQAYPWPGNVRELAIVLKRAAVLASDRITLRDLPPGLRALPPPTRERLRDAVRDAAWAAERTLLLHAMDEAGSHRARAARLLGISQSTLLRKLRRHGLGPSAGAPARTP